MRGSITLFNDVIETTPLPKQRKGRSETFDSLRNQCLIERYSYYMDETGWRYDLLIKVISKQFWLSEITVHNVIQSNRKLLKEVRANKRTRKELVQRWPHLNWDTPDLKVYI
ncbi:MAG: hypothetical protein QM764_02070 [Chitinophagaceae bacterium]